MRTIHLAVDETALGGPRALERGLITFDYWSGYGPHSQRLSESVTLPQSFSVEIVNGAPAHPIVLAETLGVCCVRVTVAGADLVSKTWYVTVPEGTGPIAFGDLPEVDPLTFQPDTNLTAWESVVAEVQAIRDEALAVIDVVAEHRTAAGTSAFNAAASAAAAQGSENGAQTAQAGAEQSAGEASGSASAASSFASQADDALNQTVLRLAEADARATDAADSADAAANSAGAAEFSAARADSARNEATNAADASEQSRVAAEAARDIATAQTFAGSAAPNGTNIDSLTTAGIYRFNSAAASSALNAPTGFLAGTIEVQNILGTTAAIVQRATPYSSQVLARMFWLRERRSNAWGPWRVFASQRIDETAGRVVYTWDDVNQREQMIYGDTGWRDIGGSLFNGWTPSTGRIHLRRVGHVVAIALDFLDAAAATADGMYTLPAGFRPAGFTRRTMVWHGTTPVPFSVAASGGVAMSRAAMPTTRSPSGGANEIQWFTSEPWPTTLPGVAV